MYLYFFDIDDTLCVSKSVFESIIKDIDTNSFSKQELDDLIHEGFSNYGHENLELMEGPALSLLNSLINSKYRNNIYYITARNGRAREASKLWLEKHNLWLGNDKLIMDSGGKKGFIINSILQKCKNEKFAFLFDDMLENHQNSLEYKNIIPCLPTLINI